MAQQVSLERLDNAILGCADLIERHPRGHKLWPLFERLEREREAMVGQTDRLAAARARIKARSQGQTAALA